jgi:hypothetical protein
MQCIGCSAFFHIQKQILSEFDVDGLYQQLLNEFCFDLFWSAIILAFHGAQKRNFSVFSCILLDIKLRPMGMGI